VILSLKDFSIASEINEPTADVSSSENKLIRVLQYPTTSFLTYDSSRPFYFHEDRIDNTANSALHFNIVKQVQLGSKNVTIAIGERIHIYCNNKIIHVKNLSPCQGKNVRRVIGVHKKYIFLLGIGRIIFEVNG
jgi:hypothetical protein